MTEYNVHSVRFVEYLPKAINSAAFDLHSNYPKVALSREDGSIEIRDPVNDWVLKQTIPGQDGRTVEHLVWCDGRLFSGGLNSEIIEWNLETLAPKYNQDSYGGPVWCLRFSGSKQFLAAGCEDGSVRLFEVCGSGLLYDRCLHRQEHRILSVAWSKKDDFIFTGGFDSTIRMYNVKTGQILSRMLTENTREQNTMIWSIEVLVDMTIVIGDSLGNTQFWDGHTGTLLQSVKSHLADVLAVAVSDDGQTVFSTGVDSKVCQFNLIHTGNDRSWVLCKSVRSTNHDTRTLAICSKPYNCMISGGIDPRFVVYDLNDFNSQTFTRFSCLPLHNIIQLARNANMLLYKEQKKISIWELQHNKGRKKLFEVNSGCKDDLLCSAISTNGKFVAYSSLSKSCLLGLYYDASNPSIIKKGKPAISSQMCFTEDESKLISVGFQKYLNVFDVENVTNEKIMFPTDTTIHLPILKLCISPDDTFISILDASSNCFIFSLAELKYETKLPAVDSAITALSFHPITNNLVVVTSKKLVYEFHINSQKFVPWAFDLNSSNVVSNMGRAKDKIQFVGFNPKIPDELFFQTTYVFGKIKYGCEIPSQVVPEESKMKKKRKLTKHEQAFFNSHVHGSDILFFDFNNDGELVVVERPIASIIQNLPEPLKIKRFGD